MKTILHFLKENIAIFILFLVWVGVTIPNLNIYWMLVDDGYDVVFSRTLFEKLSGFNFVGFVSQLLEVGGRFRPIYWLYQMLVWLIGQNSYQFQHLAHMLVIGITVFFIYLIISELTKSKLASFFGSITYLLIPTNSENIFRMGPQEPLLVLFLSIIFYLLIKNKKIFLPCLVLVFAIFTKETSVALIPVVFLYYLLGKNNKLIKNKKQSFYLWSFVCISSIIVILIAFLRRSGYSTNYFFNLPMLVDNLLFYLKELIKDTLFVFPLLFFIYCLRTAFVLSKKRNILFTKLDFFEFVFALGFICFLLIQLPWQYPIPRYLMPTVFFLILFLYLEIYQDIILLSKTGFIKNNRRILAPFLAISGAYIFLIWGFQLVSKEVSSVSYYEAFKKMASYHHDVILLINTPKAENTMESIDETRIQLSEFWNRKDLKVDYLDFQNLPKGNYVVVDSDQLPRNYPQDELKNIFKNNSDIIKSSSRGVIITTPLELIKQSVKKLANLLIRKKRITSDGLYTYYYNYNNWYFYNK